MNLLCNCSIKGGCFKQNWIFNVTSKAKCYRLFRCNPGSYLWLLMIYIATQVLDYFLCDSWWYMLQPSFLINFFVICDDIYIYSHLLLRDQKKNAPFFSLSSWISPLFPYFFKISNLPWLCFLVSRFYDGIHYSAQEDIVGS